MLLEKMISYTALEVKGRKRKVNRFSSKMRELAVNGEVEIKYDSSHKISRGAFRFPDYVYAGIMLIPSSVRIPTGGVSLTRKEEVNNGEYSFRTEWGMKTEAEGMVRQLENLKIPREIPAGTSGVELTARIEGAHRVNTFTGCVSPTMYSVVGSINGSIEGVLWATSEVRKKRVGNPKIVEESLTSCLIQRVRDCT